MTLLCASRQHSLNYSISNLVALPPFVVAGTFPSTDPPRFLRDYIRRCMGAEHVCCDSEDYEQAQKIAKAIKYAVHLKKVHAASS